jgi:hypothetical protein
MNDSEIVRVSSTAPRNPHVTSRVFRFPASACATPAQESDQPHLVVMAKPAQRESYASLPRVACALEVIRIASAYPTVSAIRTCLGGGSRSTILQRLSELGVERAYDTDEPDFRLPSEALCTRIMLVAWAIERDGQRPTVRAVARTAQASPNDVCWVLRTIRGRLSPPPVRYRCRSWRGETEWFVLVEEDAGSGSGTDRVGAS